jgi:predicted enzyme related to lactoylglutathione lyase
MLREIDCVMVPVPDLEAGVDLYQRAFGLTVHWRDDVSVGMGLQNSKTEVVLNVDGIAGVHYLVDDVPAAVERALAEGCALTVAPFEIVIGWCAVLSDPFGNPVYLLDMTKGPRG